MSPYMEKLCQDINVHTFYHPQAIGALFGKVYHGKKITKKKNENK